MNDENTPNNYYDQLKHQVRENPNCSGSTTKKIYRKTNKNYEISNMIRSLIIKRSKNIVYVKYDGLSYFNMIPLNRVMRATSPSIKSVELKFSPHTSNDRGVLNFYRHLQLCSYNLQNSSSISVILVG